MRYILYMSIFAILSGFMGCTMDNPYTLLAPGKWRGVLMLDGKISEQLLKERLKEGKTDASEFTGGDLPFMFYVSYQSDSVMRIEIENGSERIVVDEVLAGHNRTNGKDSVVIHFPHYDSYIVAYFEERVMEGKWVVTTRQNYEIPFVAQYGEDSRFPLATTEHNFDVSGQWQVTFGGDGEEPEMAIGEFRQTGNKLSGTFRTATGDYRFLEGVIAKDEKDARIDRIKLSVFDGSHAYLFESKVTSDSTMSGSFRAGTHYRTVWTARKDASAELPDPDQLTQYTKQPVAVSFPNTEGKLVSLRDERYQNKVVILQVLGTWCPNCADEARMLGELYKKEQKNGLEIIGLAFEKHTDTAKVHTALELFKKRLQVSYEVLHAGSSNKQAAQQTLPFLDKVMAFPTMVVLDKKGQIRKVHTGFDGPATSRYEAFKTEFEAFIGKLLHE